MVGKFGMSWGALLTALCMMMSNRLTLAYVLVAQHNWNSGGLQGWTNLESWVELSNPNAGGIKDTGYLRLRFLATSPEPSEEWLTLVYVDAQA
ncbi:MAG: hypothetical protein N2255_04435, partial [Kiritimatiellae bacterium]|nr:hypothetical protein [Kiritimatiellia bacterium]